MGRHFDVCPNCVGTGQIISHITDFESVNLVEDCPICRGYGMIHEDYDEVYGNWADWAKANEDTPICE